MCDSRCANHQSKSAPSEVAGGAQAARDGCRHKLMEQTPYCCKHQWADLQVSVYRRHRKLEAEHQRLTRVIADRALDRKS
jgi:hypothetical protein